MLSLRKISKAFDGKPLLKEISFDIRAAETVCLLGASGSGKSTILQLIAGLDVPDSGQVVWNRADLAGVPAHRREFGLVFQDYALFPHLSVAENVAFGLRMRNIPRMQTLHRVREVLELVGMAGFQSRRVTGLSGGEQQRVALARALAPKPRLIMFDEPIGALDRVLRIQLLEDLRKLLQLAHIPALYVTHDQEEAFQIGDRLLLLHEGRIVRDGTPEQLIADPGSAWGAEFLGLGNVLAGKVVARRRVETTLGTFTLHCDHTHPAGESVDVLARPIAGGDAEITGRVSEVRPQRDRYDVMLEGNLRVSMERPARVGQRVRVALEMQCLGKRSEHHK